MASESSAHSLTGRARPLAPLALLMAVAALLAGGQLTRAATVRTVNTLADVVNPNDNFLSLREAIAISPSGDTINFAVTGTLTLTGGELAIGRRVLIQGPGARRLTLSGNNASRVFNISGTEPVYISGLTMTRGRAPLGPPVAGAYGSAYGGAIHNTAPLTLESCAVTGSIAQGGSGTEMRGGGGAGGGIYNTGALTLRNCLVSGNQAASGAGLDPGPTLAYGGGIHSRAPVSLTNTTVTGNSSSHNGGGVWVGSYSGERIFVACTITQNTVFSTTFSDRTGGLYAFDKGAVVRNTLIAGNTAGGQPADVRGTFVSQGYNLIGARDNAYDPDSGSPWLATDLSGTQAAPLDPLVGPLQNNGGPTDSCALFPGSAALERGDNSLLGSPTSLIRDQRGLPRRIGAQVDIGAFERDLPQTNASLTVNTLQDADDGIAGLHHCTLREALQAANSQGDTSQIRFAAGLAGVIPLEPALGGLAITQPVVITGPGARTLSVSGENRTRVFEVTGDGVTISGLTIRYGAAAGAGGTSNGGHGMGGGVHNTGRLTLNACALSYNNAWGGSAAANNTDAYGGNGLGAGIYNAGTLIMTRCTANGNVARGGEAYAEWVAQGGRGAGGALYNTGTATLTNCTMHGNFGQGGWANWPGPPEGGGVYNAGTLTLIQGTVAGNYASGGGLTSGGGLFSAPGSNTRLLNTLVALNESVNYGPDVSGAVVSLANNLVGKADDSSGWTASDRTGTKAAPLVPGLAGLGNNGGPTDTRALLAGSPAINSANSSYAPATDQRGYQRPDAADIGAFELGGFSYEPPANVSVTPSSVVSKTGVQRTFTARYTDPNGASNFKAAYFLVNTTAAPGSGLYCYYDAVSNKLYLRNRANTAWLGGVAPGASSIIRETGGRGRLHAAQTTVGRSGTTLTIGWSITPETPLEGNRKTFLYSQDTTNRSDGWDELGAWVVSAPPVNLSVAPTPLSTRAGVARTLVAAYSDANGTADLTEAWLCVNTEPKNGGGLMVRYAPAANKLYLRHSTTGAWLGGVTPGTASVIQDPGGRGSLNCGSSSVARSGNTLTVRFNLTPSSTMAGEKSVYLYSTDTQSQADGWDTLGAWTINP